MSSTTDNLTLSPSNAPPVLEDDGSTASKAIFLPWLAQCEIILSTKHDFPTPGAPVIAIVSQCDSCNLLELSSPIIESASSILSV